MRVNWPWFLGVLLLTLILLPVTTYQLSFFGIDLGSIEVAGIPLEHEAFGIGLLAASLASISISRRLSIILAILAAFLIISELWPGPPLNDIFENPVGAGFSIFLGAYYGLALPRAFPEEVEG